MRVSAGKALRARDGTRDRRPASRRDAIIFELAGAF